MENKITLRIRLLKPTPGVDFGLQKGAGTNYETVQRKRSTGNDLNFEPDISLKSNKNSTLNFSGEFVQGPPSARFIYIDIGTYAGQKDSIWSRRLKIPLTGIPSETLQKLLADPGLVLQTNVEGTGKDGGPNCATVKPFEGWHLAKKDG